MSYVSKNYISDNVPSKNVRKFSKSSKNSKESTGDSANTYQNNDTQSMNLSGSFGENTNGTKFRASSACPVLNPRTDLQRQVAELSQSVIELKSTIYTKDIQLENIRRDNERLASELKKQQRCNRNLKQQLDDERFFYQKEKEHFCEEIQINKAKCVGSTTKAQQQQRRETERIREALENENKQLKDEIIEKNEVTYNLCIKFLRMKDARDSLRQKLDRLLQEHLQVMAEMMEKLDEAREELNIIVSDRFQEPLPICKAKFLQVVQRNGKLVYENSTLKLHIQQLTMNIEKLKNNAEKTKTINVDARTIEKLSECSRRRRSEEVTRLSTSLSCGRSLDKSLSASKSASSANTPIVDRSANAKMISAIKSKHRGKLTIVDSQNSQTNTSLELSAERIRSAPEIVQSSIFRQAQFSETPTNCDTDFTQRSMDSRDVGTNP